MTARDASVKTTRRPCMPLIPALEVLREARADDDIVVTTMGTAREWPRLSTNPLDFHYIPSAMGHAPMIGLGLALARPERQVLCFNGDGCMLMSLGCLVTIAGAAPENLTLLVLNNGIYEVTGGQKTAAAASAADFVGLAIAAGWPSAASFDNLDDWRAGWPQALTMPGPRFIELVVEPVADYMLEVPGPMSGRIERFRAALGT